MYARRKFYGIAIFPQAFVTAVVIDVISLEIALDRKTDFFSRFRQKNSIPGGDHFDFLQIF